MERLDSAREIALALELADAPRARVAVPAANPLALMFALMAAMRFAELRASVREPEDDEMASPTDADERATLRPAAAEAMPRAREAGPWVVV